MSVLKEYLAAITDILLPRICFACEEKINSGYLCKNCLAQIEFLYPPRCQFCSRRLFDKKEKICQKCSAKTHAYERLICVTKYKGPIIELIHLFKYKSYDFLAEFFATLMAKHLTKIGFNPSNYNSITAVPIHSAKLRDRGYNQAGLLAQFLANYFKISFKNDIIYATGESLPQAKLDKISRVKNIKGLFYSQGNLENKKVILVDDIFTTGSTANECAVTLKQNGAKVTVLTLSKTTIY